MKRPFAIFLITTLLGVAAPAFAQTMDHDAHTVRAISGMPSEAGQSAFAAIQEIVARLSADPATDWSKVSIDALRQHLVDMDELVRNASAETETIANGVHITITGAGRTRRAVQAMVPAHAAELDRIVGWSAQGEKTNDGATLTVSSSDTAGLQKIMALGFYGLMATGAHHQSHHWAIANGSLIHDD